MPDPAIRNVVSTSISAVQFVPDTIPDDRIDVRGAFMRK